MQTIVRPAVAVASERSDSDHVTLARALPHATATPSPSYLFSYRHHQPHALSPPPSSVAAAEPHSHPSTPFGPPTTIDRHY
jgi:hypothetical protein